MQMLNYNLIPNKCIMPRVHGMCLCSCNVSLCMRNYRINTQFEFSSVSQFIYKCMQLYNMSDLNQINVDTLNNNFKM